MKPLACKHCGKIVYVKAGATSIVCDNCITQCIIYSNVCKICGKHFNVRYRRKTCCKEHAKLLRI